MADLTFDKCLDNLSSPWKAIFKIIDDNFEKVKLYILSQYSSLTVEQFEGDEKTNDFHINEPIQTDTTVLIFRGDEFYAKGLSSVKHSIINQTLHLVDELSVDEDLTVWIIRSNTLAGDVDFLTGECKEVEERLKQQLEVSTASTLGLQSFETYIDQKAEKLGLVVGDTPLPGGATTLTEAMKLVYDAAIGGTGGYITPTDLENIRKLATWMTANNEEVAAYIRDLVESYDVETLDEIQMVWQNCAQIERECARHETTCVGSETLITGLAGEVRTDKEAVAADKTFVEGLRTTYEELAQQSADSADEAHDYAEEARTLVESAAVQKIDASYPDSTTAQAIQALYDDPDNKGKTIIGIFSCLNGSYTINMVIPTTNVATVGYIINVSTGTMSSVSVRP